MRIECTISMSGSDVRCPVCGQGVLIDNPARQRDLAMLQRGAVSRELREHHISFGGHTCNHFSADLAQALATPPTGSPQPILAR